MYNGFTAPSISAPTVWVNCTTATTATNSVFFSNQATSSFTQTAPAITQAQQHAQAMAQYNAGVITKIEKVEVVPDHIHLQVGKRRKISFPDGTLIEFLENGSFLIHDKDAKVVYKAARCRDFNPFINASDKLEAFIKFCGTVGVRQGDMLGIPIKHFVQWLVIEAAIADGDSPNRSLLSLPDYRTSRCRTCGRFMSPQLKADRIEFCRPRCLEIQLSVHHNRSKSNGYQGTSKTRAQILEARAETGTGPAAAATETAGALRSGV